MLFAATVCTVALLLAFATRKPGSSIVGQASAAVIGACLLNS
jgi:hypothetical protein